ncbi:hypothetical protein IFM89_016297 [Coptis chinensis]|uniref:X8 domain-containing protein n=1 Tax=Coptis chinensis TaxID=261450 RepID=A0A835H3D1_9MAGN|nr:hypothetical protein IFM89_016297 [Coptis chinensis]
MRKLFLASVPLTFFVFLLCFASCTESYVPIDYPTDHIGKVMHRPKYSNKMMAVPDDMGNKWCIAKPSTDENKLRANLDFCCKQNGVDCSIIGQSGSCFDPNNIVSHASVAMNLYYKAAGKHGWNCYFDNSAVIVSTDPFGPWFEMLVLINTKYLESEAQDYADNTAIIVSTDPCKCEISEAKIQSGMVKGVVPVLTSPVDSIDWKCSSQTPPVTTALKSMRFPSLNN